MFNKSIKASDYGRAVNIDNRDWNFVLHREMIDALNRALEPVPSPDSIEEKLQRLDDGSQAAEAFRKEFKDIEKTYNFDIQLITKSDKAIWVMQVHLTTKTPRMQLSRIVETYAIGTPATLVPMPILKTFVYAEADFGYILDGERSINWTVRGQEINNGKSIFYSTKDSKGNAIIINTQRDSGARALRDALAEYRRSVALKAYRNLMKRFN